MNTWTDLFLRETKHSARRLMRDWRFTAAAVLFLALGIGANTAIFSAVNAVLFKKQPFANPDQLVDIYQNGVNAGGLDASSYPAYLDMASYADVFASTTAVFVPRGVKYEAAGTLRPAVVEHTTATYPAVLGLRTTLGRWFDASEDVRGAAVVAVIGHQAWIRQFAADPSVVGRTIRIDGVPVTIVGVGPAGHNGTINIGLVTDFWLPIWSLPTLGASSRVLERRPEEAGFFVKARLADGVTVAQAQAAMNNLAVRLKAEHPKEDPGAGISVFASNDVHVHPQMDALLKALASVLLIVVGLVLAIACTNLATLLLVRGAARAKELSIRLAIGATRRQLVRHLLVESVLLSSAGGIAGCILAWWAIRSLRAFDLPIVVDFGVDYRVLAFAVALSFLTGIAFGLAPALKSTRIDLVPMLRDDGQAAAPGRWLTSKNVLVAFQVAVSVVLLGGTSVFLQMLSASRTGRIGYAVDGVAMLEGDARYARYSTAEASRLYDELRRRVAAIPGVESAALTRGLPMSVTSAGVVVERAGAGTETVAQARMIWAGPGYFDVLRIPLLFGRAFDERDGAETARAAIVNETMARQYFGAVNVVGRRFRLEPDSDGWFEIVGVVRDTGTSDLQGDLIDPTPQLFYRSFAQAGLAPTTLVARTSLDAAPLLVAMQREVRALDSTLWITSAKTMAQYLEESLAMPKAVAGFLGALGVMGMLLATIGLYAVVAFAVSRRSREIGIRMALGARRRQVVWSVAREVAVLVGVGTIVGVVLSLAAIVALRAVVAPAPGVSFYRPAADPVALAAIVALMAMVGVAAAYLPARRAAKLDPMAALRHD